MNLQQLKMIIENKQELPNVVIFVCKKSKFIPQQYVSEIRKVYGIEPQYINTLEQNDTVDIFGIQEINTNNSLTVFSTDELNLTYEISEQLYPIFIICEKIVKNDLTNAHKNDILEIEAVEDWQLKDFVYSLAKGASKKDLDWLLDNCKDIYRLNNELEKYKIFSEGERKHLFEMFSEDGAYDDLCNTTAIDFSNYIVYKDTENLKRYYPYLKQLEIDGFAVLGIVYNSMRNLLVAHMGRNIVANDYGMSDKQLYFLRTKSLPCDINSFLNKFLRIGEIDQKVKDGEILAQDMIDFIINIMYE